MGRCTGSGGHPTPPAQLFPQLGTIYEASRGESPSSDNFASAGCCTSMALPQCKLLASRSSRERPLTVAALAVPFPSAPPAAIHKEWEACVAAGLGKPGSQRCFCLPGPRPFVSGSQSHIRTHKAAQRERKWVLTQRKNLGLTSSILGSGSRTVPWTELI